LQNGQPAEMAEVTESAPEAAPGKPESAASHTLTRVATAAVLIPLVLALVLWAPEWLFVGVLALVALLTLGEYLDLAEKTGLAPLRYFSYVGTLLLVTWPVYQFAFEFSGLRSFYRFVVWYPAQVVTPLLVLLVLALAMRPVRSLDKALPGASASLLGVLYIGLPLSLLVDIRRLDGPLWVIYVLTLTWVSDSAAYFIGRALGRHRMSPRISPAKTWEGAVASVILGVAFGMAYMKFNRPDSSLGWSAVIALAVNLAGQIGDLAESALKRSAGAKDSSTILPGHGGFLDRLDALLFAVPALWYILALRDAWPSWGLR